MTLETRKLEFIQEFLKVDREDVVEKLEEILHEEIGVSLPFSPKELDERINKSIEDSAKGRLTSNDILMKEVQKWR